MDRLKEINIHPDFPKKVWIIVEQPRNEPYRLKYDPISNRFIQTKFRSLIFERGFNGVYGWIGGLGLPPDPHCDIYLLTQKNPQVGDVLLGYVCGVFYRDDVDHKIFAIDPDWEKGAFKSDLAFLDKETKSNLESLYPRISESEGWYGAKEAHLYLNQLRLLHD